MSSFHPHTECGNRVITSTWGHSCSRPTCTCVRSAYGELYLSSIFPPGFKEVSLQNRQLQDAKAVVGNAWHVIWWLVHILPVSEHEWVNLFVIWEYDQWSALCRDQPQLASEDCGLFPVSFTFPPQMKSSRFSKLTKVPKCFWSVRWSAGNRPTQQSKPWCTATQEDFSEDRNVGNIFECAESF